MRKILLYLTIFLATNLYSQFQEIVAGVGYSYYFGDLNTANTTKVLALIGDQLDIKNFKMSYSLGYRYNFDKYISIGANFYHMYISGYDSDNKAARPSDAAFGRQVRNLNFHSVVNEVFLDARFEPFRTPKNWNKNKIHISPYIGAGIGLFSFNPKSFNKAGQAIELQPLGTEGQGLVGYENKYSLLQFVVPVNAGIRFTPKTRKFSIIIDFNYNHTFTDYLDDVSTTYANPIDFANAYQIANPSVYNALLELADKRPLAYKGEDIRGNKSNNDFFITGQIKFSYFLFNKSLNTFYKCCDY